MGWDRVAENIAENEALPLHNDGPWPSLRQAYYAAWILALVQMCAQLNNGVMTLLVGPVKRDLGLSDMQMSYLLGFSVVLFAIEAAILAAPAPRLLAMAPLFALWANLHGGWLTAWGRPAMGAQFRLTLPKKVGAILETSPLPLVPRDLVGPGGTRFDGLEAPAPLAAPSSPASPAPAPRRAAAETTASPS